MWITKTEKSYYLTNIFYFNFMQLPGNIQLYCNKVNVVNNKLIYDDAIQFQLFQSVYYFNGTM